MKHATSRTLTATVHGTRRTVAIVPGTRIDLDEVIGDTDGAPLTLEDALGPDLVAGCDLTTQAADEAAPGTRASRGRHQSRVAPTDRTHAGQPAAAETEE